MYTAVDWKEGIIHQDLSKRKLPEIVLKKMKNVGYLSDVLFSEKMMSKEDHLLIDAIMKTVFFDVLEHNVKERVNYFRRDLESAYRPDLLLNERISELQRKLDLADNYSKEQAFKGEWCKRGIDYEVYRKINDEGYTKINFSIIQFTPSATFEDRLGGFHQVFTDEFYQWQNVIFDVLEILRFKEILESIRDEGEKLFSNSDYPVPSEIAQRFINGAKNPEYDLEDYTCVMTIARDNYEVRSISKLIDIARESEGSTSAVKRKVSPNTMRRWIKYYDENAEIKRK